MNQTNQLQILQNEIESCTKCKLHSSRTHTVFARGNPEAKLCFIGEAPGEDEDLQGLPFVGRSGQLLDKTLLSLGLNINEDIYVCNIVKCRPPNNRKPEAEETWSCFPYLERQLALTKAKVLVSLGSTSTSALLKTADGITKIRGRLFKFNNYDLIPTLHPSYILRNGGITSEAGQFFIFDLKLALDKVNENVNSAAPAASV